MLRIVNKRKFIRGISIIIIALIVIIMLIVMAIKGIISMFKNIGTKKEVMATTNMMTYNNNTQGNIDMQDTITTSAPVINRKHIK